MSSIARQGLPSESALSDKQPKSDRTRVVLAPKLAPNVLARDGMRRDGGSLLRPEKPQKTSRFGTLQDSEGRGLTHFETTPIGEATPDHVVVRALHAGSF
jgi:hypothetical protein